jgi:hypothetical protein
MKTTQLLRILALMLGPWLSVMGSVTLPDITKEKLTHLGHVFDVTDGEATIKSQGIKRVEIGKSSIVVTLDSSIQQGASVTAHFNFYNRTGMRVAWASVLLPAQNSADEITKTDGTLFQAQDLAELLGNTALDLNTASTKPVFVVITCENAHFNIARQGDQAKNIPEKAEGVKDAPLIEGATAAQPQIDRNRPRPHPQIVKQSQVRPAIFEKNKFGTTNIGPLAIDDKWSNYGVYLQKMIETVQIQWDKLLEDSQIYSPAGSTVIVKFILNSEGRITTVVKVDNNATEPAARACVNAITERSPYGPWTDDMKATLGEEQEMTFSFYYR